jgi:DNA polymerase/3'-5' exonuclease PolX
MRVLQAVSQLLDPPVNRFIQNDAEREVRLVMRRCRAIQDPIAQLCALHGTTKTPFDTLVDMYSGARTHFSNDLGFPPIELTNVLCAWSEFYRPAVKLLEEERRQRELSKGLFRDIFVVMVPYLDFSAAQALKQLHNLMYHGGDGVVHSSSDSSPCVLSRRAMHGRTLCVVCCDPVVARRVVSCRGQFSVYKLNFVPHSIRDDVIKSAKVYAHPEESYLGNSMQCCMQSNTRCDACPGAGILSLGKRLRVDSSKGPQFAPNAGCKRTKADPTSSFACLSSRTKKELELNFPNNELICETLTILLDFYTRHRQAYKSDNVSSFRCGGYQRAIAFIRRLDYDITGLEDVEELKKCTKVIGHKLCCKIKEIVQTGRLREADEKLANPVNQPLRELCSVWGVGPTTASTLIFAGIASVQELRLHVLEHPSVLDRQQHIGLRHHEDLLRRIPRQEVQTLELYLKEKVHAIAGDTIDIIIAGSYLRGKASCGDVDCMLRGRRGHVEHAMATLVRTMSQEHVITDHLVWGKDKYFGVYRLSPEHPHRRLDLFAVPDEEYPFSLLTFTGSGIFNRSMRLKARKMGYTLSHKGLTRVLHRWGKSGKEVLGSSIHVRSEADIFRFLGIPFKIPSERDI